MSLTMRQRRPRGITFSRQPCTDGHRRLGAKMRNFIQTTPEDKLQWSAGMSMVVVQRGVVDSLTFESKGLACKYALLHCATNNTVGPTNSLCNKSCTTGH